MDTSSALEWKTVLNPLWFLLFSLFFFLNLFSRGKQQCMRFQLVILKMITLLLNSRVSAANLPNLPPHGLHPILPVSILTSSSHQYFCKQLHHLILLSIFLHRNFLSFCICWSCKLTLRACVYFFFQTRLPRAMARMATGGPHF